MMLNTKISLLLLTLVSTYTLQANDNIFKEMMQIQQDMDKMFNKMQQNHIKMVSAPSRYTLTSQQTFVDKLDHYEFLTNIPENKENKIDINIKNRVLSLTAKIIEKHEEKSAHGYSSSSSVRMYKQNIPIPSDANERTLKANYIHGHLVLLIDKKTEKKIYKEENNTIENNVSKQINPSP